MPAPSFSWRVTADATLPDVAPPGLAGEVSRAFRPDGGLPDVDVDGNALRLTVHAPGATKEEAAASVAAILQGVLRDLGIEGDVSAAVGL